MKKSPPNHRGDVIFNILIPNLGLFKYMIFIPLQLQMVLPVILFG